MPKWYCDYCDVFLTHESAKVRRDHTTGWKHMTAVRNYFGGIAQTKLQAVADELSLLYGIPYGEIHPLALQLGNAPSAPRPLMSPPGANAMVSPPGPPPPGSFPFAPPPTSGFPSNTAFPPPGAFPPPPLGSFPPPPVGFPQGALPPPPPPMHYSDESKRQRLY